MKKNIALIAAFIIGIYGFSGTIAMAAQDEMQGGSQEESLEDQAEHEHLDKSAELQTEEENQEESIGDPIGEADTESNVESSVESGNPGENAKSAGGTENPEGNIETSEADVDSSDSDISKPQLCNLQIPQKIGIIIDPWELDGKGQIYSEQYVIQNTGETAGTLVLSFLCRSPEGDAVVKTDCQGLHDGEEKSIYLEMVLGDGTCIPLSQNGSQYETELEAGEEITLCFSGEVNENASKSWGNKDVEVEGVYSWSSVEEVQVGTPDQSDDSAEASDIKDISSEESSGQDTSSDEKGAQESIAEEDSRNGAFSEIDGSVKKDTDENLQTDNQEEILKGTETETREDDPGEDETEPGKEDVAKQLETDDINGQEE